MFCGISPDFHVLRNSKGILVDITATHAEVQKKLPTCRTARKECADFLENPAAETLAS